MSDEEALEPLLITKKIKPKEDAHGGAWKVAYADFVTAMMAFFLLLWLLNATTEEQKRGIANYFEPQSITTGEQSGSGGSLGGLAIDAVGAMKSAGSPPSVTIPISSAGGEKSRKGKGEATLTSSEPNPDSTNIEARKREREEFDRAQADLRLAVERNDALKDFQDSLLIDNTPEGLRIQLIDRQKIPMFKPGSATLNPYSEALLQIITRVITRFPNPVSIAGHTDGAPRPENARFSNWELSAKRANTARRTMVEAGLPKARIAAVVGRADTDLLFPEKPESPQNRRISILLVRMAKAPESGGNGDARVKGGR